MRRKWFLAGLVLTGALTAACARTIAGAPTADPNATVAPSTTKSTDNPLATGTPSTYEQKLCKLLTFDDLPYKNQGSNVTNPTAQTNIDNTFDESCEWRYTLVKPALGVGVRLFWAKNRDLSVHDPGGAYTVAGRQILYHIEPSLCALSTKYSDGWLGIGVADPTGLFGPTCEQGRHLAEVLIGREPQSLS